EAGNIYPWGNEFDPERCNSAESAQKRTTSIGHFSPVGDSPYGVADMAGNVAEWTASLNMSYPYQADDGREDPETVGDRVVRGGPYNSYKSGVRCAERGSRDATRGSGYLGFRCVHRP